MWSLKGFLKTLGLAALATHGARANTNKTAVNYAKYTPYKPAHTLGNMDPHYWAKGGPSGRSKTPGWQTRSTHTRSHSKRSRSHSTRSKARSLIKEIAKSSLKLHRRSGTHKRARG